MSRHLRRMKRIYPGRSNALLASLEGKGLEVYPSADAVVLRLADGVDDRRIAQEAYAYGLAPGSLSRWYRSESTQRSGLLLGVATTIERQLPNVCDRLHRPVTAFTPVRGEAASTRWPASRRSVTGRDPDQAGATDHDDLLG